MYTQMLVPIDGSKLSDTAVAHAVELAQRVGAKITLFYASPDYPMPAYADGIVYEPITKKEYAKMAQEEAARVMDEAMKKATSAGVECAQMHVIAAAPWEAILKAAKKSKCDVIVMASHGRRGLSAVLLGSETQKVLTHSKLPVLVVR